MRSDVLSENAVSGTRSIPWLGLLLKLNPLEILPLGNIDNGRKRGGCEKDANPERGLEE
jgi:hypothetical protein